jgi:hypothetical protein
MDESTDLGASKPIPQPAYKPQPTQHSIVKACNHKIDLNHFPTHSNCWDCWQAFFSVSPEGVASVHQLLLQGGTKAVIAMHGAKFVKFFGKFLQQKLLQEYASPAVQAASGIEGSIMDIKAESEGTLGIRQES